MNIVDSVVILLLLLGAVLGYKKGFIKSMVTLIGTIVVIVVSFKLKTPIANFMLKYLPFLNFSGIFKDLPVINILVYEAIAFLLVFVLLSSILGIIINISGVIEKLLKATIVLGLVSKILGAIAGLLEMITFVFVALVALAQFNVTSSYVMESKIGKAIIDRTPLLSRVCSPMVASIEEIHNLIDKYDKTEDKNTLNVDALSVMVKYNIITAAQANEFGKSGKLKIGEYTIY